MKEQRLRDSFVHFQGLDLIYQRMPGRKIETHSHAGHELFIPLQNEIRVSTQGQRLVCGPGRMLYLPPLVEHSFEASDKGSGERVICILDSSLWKRNGGEKVEARTLPVQQLCKELVFHLLLNPKTRFWRSFVETFAQTLIEALIAPSVGPELDFDALGSSVSDERVRKALSIIDERGLEDLSTGEIAKECGLSLRNLNRLFAAQVAKSPKQLLVARRIQEAEQRLMAGGSVTEVAYSVGYNSLSQFIEAFRSLTGQLPSDLRRRSNKL